MSKLIVLIAFLLVTAACGGDGDGAPVTAAPQTASSGTAAACSAETARAAAPVLQGGGIEGAASYSGESPHPIVLIQPNGDLHPSCQSLPFEWVPLGVADTQLVALIGDEEQTVIERCTYQNGPDVVRYQSELTVQLVRAADGVELASTSLQGTSPRLCDEAERQDLTSLSGEPVADTQIISWLAKYTMASVLVWSRVPQQEVLSGGAMSAVVAGGPGLVAVGWDESGGDADAAVWTSPDGLVWSRVPHDDAVFGGPDGQRMSAVVAGGPGLVAVGRDESAGLAAVWISPDGLVWSRVPQQEAPYGSAMNAVVAGGPGLVAVGSDGSGAVAAVWTSPDGLVWSRVPHDDAIFDGEEPMTSQVMEAVVAGGPGLVAVGWDESGGDADAAVWTSPDGLVWSRVPHDDAVFGGPDGQSMSAVVAGGPGLVAVGWDSSGGGPVAAVWTSPDGLVWSRVPQDEPLSGGAMSAVVAGDSGLVAVGADPSGAVAAVWTSPDGLLWFRVPHDDAIFGGTDDQGMSAAVAGGTGLVAVGWDSSGPAVWVSPHRD